MIIINDDIAIDEDEISFSFIRSSGPGGQNVNKVSTAVQLKFNIIESKNLPEKIKARLLKHTAKRVSNDGTLIIESKKFRSQERNKVEAIERLVKLVKTAAIEKKKRVKTNPTKISAEKRITSKKQRSEVKKLRKNIRNIDN